jgi:hypothetical protein
MKKEPTFDDIIRDATLDIHQSLLIGGSKEMRASIHKWLSYAILWNKKMEEKDNG